MTGNACGLSRSREWEQETHTTLSKHKYRRDSFVSMALRIHRRPLLRAAAKETFLIATLLGTNLTLGQVILFEGVVSLLRAAFFFLPGALGAQEAGTVLLFQAIGIPAPAIAAAAFVLLRRLRELVWIVFGLFLLWRFQMSPLDRDNAVPEAFPA